MSTALRLAALVLCSLLALSARADVVPQVQLPEPPPANEKPERYIDRAQQSFQAGQYVDAGDNLYRAYLLSPKPIYLFNAGQSYRKGGHADQALAVYDQFLQVAPEHPLSNEARAYKATLESLLKEQRTAKDTELKLLGELEQQKELNKETERKLKEAETRKVPVYKRAWFGAVIATAGVLVIGGVLTGVGLLAKYKTDGGTVPVQF